MRDDAYTNPATIRATYAARGKNRNLNIAKVESLGIKASQVAPTQSASIGGSTSSVIGSAGTVIDPTLQYEGEQTYTDTTYDGTTYDGTTYEGALYYKDYVREPIQ